MKFNWIVNFIKGYENEHTIIYDDEETIINEDRVSIEIKNFDGKVPDPELVYYDNGEEKVFENSDEINPCISGNMPEGTKLIKKPDGNYAIIGKLPIVNEETTYYFTFRARNKNTDDEYEYDDMFFSIIVKNKNIFFIDKSPYEFTENLYTKYQLELLNSEGNEDFIKFSGKLPKGINLSSSGLLYGTAYLEDDTDENNKCVIEIRRNGKSILQHEIITKVISLSSLNSPIWITDSGQLASINYGDIINSSLFVKAYDPNNLKIIYELVQGYKLPDGLSLNNSTGQIYGKCLSKENKLWNFKISVSNGEKKVERLFLIETNKISDDKYIKWITPTNLGSYKIGANIYYKFETESNYDVTYNIVSNTLPKGLTFDNGLLYGKIKYQDLKTYNFIIEANNGYNVVQEKFSIKVEKGLGKNAMKCYFYINHDYDDDYKDMRSYFNKVNAYEPKNALFKINQNPEINICECKCFDIQLMKHLLYFNESLDIIWGRTIRNDYIVDDKPLYTVFYKDISENLPTGGVQTWGGDKIYVTKSLESSTGYFLEGTKTEVLPTSTVITDNSDVIKGKPYIWLNKQIYVKFLSSNDYYINKTKKLVDYNEVIYTESYKEYNMYISDYETLYRNYILNNEEKIYITRCDDNSLANIDTNEYLNVHKNEVEIFYGKDIARSYFIDNKKTTLSIPSTSEIRKALSKTIQVVKSDNEHIYYDPGSQEIISENYFDNEYVLYYDKDKESYYVKYNGKPVYMDVYAQKLLNDNTYDEPVPAYAEYKNDKWIESIDNKNAYEESHYDNWDNKNADTRIFYRTIDGNEKKYILKPVKVLVDFLDTDVDYQNYLIYEKGTNNLQENILFTLSWNPYTKFIILNGQSHIIEEISKPWIYEPELNSSIGFNKRIVLPYITDEDVSNITKHTRTIGKIKFFDIDNEVIPEWKVKKVDFYESNKFYYEGDIFKVDNGDEIVYYKVKENFKSGYNYEDYKEDYLVALEPDAVVDYLKPYYFPTLDLFYAIPGSEYGENHSLLPKTMEQDENNGKLLTGRKFCFFEVHFSPIYNNNIDNFSIDFYNHNNDRSPEFQLI